VIGAGLALVVAGIADTLVRALAAASLGPGGEMPQGIADKLGLALVTIGAWFSSLAHVVLRHTPALQSVLIVAVLGALVGTVIYLSRSGILRRAAPSRSTRRRRRR